MFDRPQREEEEEEEEEGTNFVAEAPEKMEMIVSPTTLPAKTVFHVKLLWWITSKVKRKE